MRPRPPTAVEDVASSQALLLLMWVRSESFEQRSRQDGSGGVWAIHRCQLLIDMSRWHPKIPLTIRCLNSRTDFWEPSVTATTLQRQHQRSTCPRWDRCEAGKGWAFRYTFSETLSKNPISDRLSPPGQHSRKNFQNLFGFVRRFCTTSAVRSPFSLS